MVPQQTRGHTKICQRVRVNPTPQALSEYKSHDLDFNPCPAELL